jgi:hypothetical protein
MVDEIGFLNLGLFTTRVYRQSRSHRSFGDAPPPDASRASMASIVIGFLLSPHAVSRVRLIQCEWPPPSPALSEQAGARFKQGR